MRYPLKMHIVKFAAAESSKQIPQAADGYPYRDRAGADNIGLLSFLPYLRLNLRVSNFIRTIRQYHTSMIPYVARILPLKSFFYVGIARFMFDSSF